MQKLGVSLLRCSGKGGVVPAETSNLKVGSHLSRATTNSSLVNVQTLVLLTMRGMRFGLVTKRKTPAIPLFFTRSAFAIRWYWMCFPGFAL